MVGPIDALRTLREHPEQVAAVCSQYRVALLTVFGSAVRPGSDPHDLDLGLLFEHDGPQDLLGVRDALVALTEFEQLDVAVLNAAGPVIRERALIGAEVLFEARPSMHANAALAAAMERMDTAWLRRLALESMAR